MPLVTFLLKAAVAKPVLLPSPVPGPPLLLSPYTKFVWNPQHSQHMFDRGVSFAIIVPPAGKPLIGLDWNFLGLTVDLKGAVSLGDSI